MAVTEERSDPVGDLISNTGDEIWGNPMIRTIVDNTETPSQAGDFVEKDLGWPGSVAARVRNAAKIRRDNAELWKQLASSNIPPSDRLFGWKRLSPNPFVQPVEVATSYRFGGCEVATDTLPFFLKELRMTKKDQTASSFDLGSYARREPVFLDDHLEYWGNDAAFGGGRQVYMQSHVHDQPKGYLNINHDGEIMYWQRLDKDGSFSVCARTRVVHSLHRGIWWPAHYRLVEIQRSIPGTDHAEQEHIYLAARCDFGPAVTHYQQDKHFGRMIYRRTQLGDNRAYVDLRLEYFFRHRSDDAFCLRQSIVTDLNTKNDTNLSNTTRKYRKLGRKLYRQSPALNQICGINLVNTPPESLASILM